MYLLMRYMLLFLSTDLSSLATTKIEWMDHLGMDEIASQEPGAFAKYIKLYKNTICGRHPIAVYLSALKENKESGVEEVEVKFVKYEHSSRVKDAGDSSVSYASGVVRKM